MQISKFKIKIESLKLLKSFFQRKWDFDNFDKC